jgi:hypothetical protein
MTAAIILYGMIHVLDRESNTAILHYGKVQDSAHGLPKLVPVVVLVVTI